MAVIAAFPRLRVCRARLFRQQRRRQHSCCPASLVMATVTRFCRATSRLLSPTVRAETGVPGGTSDCGIALAGQRTGIGGRRSPALAKGAAPAQPAQHRAAIMQGQAARLCLSVGRRRGWTALTVPLTISRSPSGKRPSPVPRKLAGIEIDFLRAQRRRPCLGHRRAGIIARLDGLQRTLVRTDIARLRQNRDGEESRRLLAPTPEGDGSGSKLITWPSKAVSLAFTRTTGSAAKACAAANRPRRRRSRKPKAGFNDAASGI